MRPRAVHRAETLAVVQFLVAKQFIRLWLIVYIGHEHRQHDQLLQLFIL